MKLSDIKPKYLVLGQDYDDFALATDKVNFDEEDLCCQIINLTAVYYWINTESVWGPMGFNWDNYNDYGSFSISKLNFNIIPKIPDSFRHLHLQNTFNNIIRQLTFLDSDWKHISTFNKLNNGSLIDWHLSSINNLPTTINDSSNVQNYILRAKLNNTSVNYDIKLYLIDENKNNLNLNFPVKNNYKDSTTIYLNKLTPENTIDLRDYIKINNCYKYDKFICIGFDFFNNIIIEINAIDSYSNKNYIIGCYNNNSAKIFDKVTFILLKDDNYDINYTNNYNTLKSKSFEYINLHENNFPRIDYYYNNGYFKNGTPEITQKILDFTRISIFTNCAFLKKYNYGRIKCTKTYFDTTISKMNTIYNQNGYVTNFYKFTITNYDIYGTELITSNYLKIFHFDNYFDFEYTDEDYNNNIKLSFPKTIYSNIIYCYYDLKIDHLRLSYSKTISSEWFSYDFAHRIITSTGIIEYLDFTTNKIAVFDNDYPIIINNNTIFKFGDYLNINSRPEMLFENNNLKDNKFIFRTNKDNLTEVKTSFNNNCLFTIHKEQNINMPLIIRSSSTAFICNDSHNSSSINKFKIHLPNLDTNLLLYRIEIDITSKNANINNDIIQYILDNITTIGDSSDASNYTIKLLSTYYQNIKEETKNKLLGDGYTIIEVL